MREPRQYSHRGWPLLGALLALAGCMVGPNFVKPQPPVNQSWNEKGGPQITTQTEADSRWWKSFNDPTLDRLIELAYRQNLQLEITGLRIVEARAQLGIATGNQFPEQQLFGSATMVGLSQDAPNGGALLRQFGDFQAGFDAAWEMDFWGKFRRGVQAEAARFLGTVTDYQDALVSLAAEVARTYVVIRTSEALVELAQQNTRLQEQGLAITQSRLKNGATSQLDVAQATSLLESTRATIPRQLVALKQARNALSTLLGQPSGVIDSLLDGPKQIPSAPATVAVSMPAEMLRRRPDIRSAEFFAAAQCSRIGVVKADLFPTFSLFGRIGLQTSTIGVDAASKNFLSDVFYSFGPTINWPFFSFGRLQNSIRVEDARLQQLLVVYRNTVLKAAQEVEDGLVGFVNFQEAMASEQRSVTAAARAVEISLIEYREGATDYQRVLDAQRTLLQQQNSLTQTQSNVTTSLIALYKALGGGWEAQQGRPVVSEPAQGEMSRRTDWGGILETIPPEAVAEPPQGKR